MKSFYQIMRTNWNELTPYELKYHILGLFILFEFFSVILSFYICLLINDFNHLLIIFVVFSFSCMLLLLFFYKRDYLDEKYVLFDSRYIGISYQGVVLFLFAFTPLFSVGVGILAFKQGGFYSALAFSLVEFFPPLFMFFRLHIYSNDTRYRLDNFYGNVVLGYHPVFYYMLSLMVCNGPLGVSLLRVFKSIFQNSISLSYSLFYFILSFSLLCFVLSPDKVNKILPFNIGTGNGFRKFAFLSLILAAILIFLMM